MNGIKKHGQTILYILSVFELHPQHVIPAKAGIPFRADFNGCPPPRA